MAFLLYPCIWDRGRRYAEAPLFYENRGASACRKICMLGILAVCGRGARGAAPSAAFKSLVRRGGSPRRGPQRLPQRPVYGRGGGNLQCVSREVHQHPDLHHGPGGQPLPQIDVQDEIHIRQPHQVEHAQPDQTRQDHPRELRLPSVSFPMTQAEGISPSRNPKLG